MSSLSCRKPLERGAKIRRTRLPEFVGVHCESIEILPHFDYVTVSDYLSHLGTYSSEAEGTIQDVSVRSHRDGGHLNEHTDRHTAGHFRLHKDYPSALNPSIGISCEVPINSTGPQDRRVSKFRRAIFKRNPGGQTMKSKPTVPLLLLLGTMAILGYSGCTAIGFCGGAIIDSQKSDYDTIPGSHVASVKSGKDIRLTKKTGEDLKGKYLGLETLDYSLYARLYNECRERHKKEFSLPALGDSISIVTLTPAKEYKAEFLRFDNQYIWVRTIDMWKATKQIHMGEIDSITDRNGNLIEVRSLINLSSAGEIPGLSAVVLNTNSDTLRIPTSAVDRIEAPADKNAKWVGLAAGVLIDAAIIVLAVSSLRGLGSGGWSWAK